MHITHRMFITDNNVIVSLLNFVPCKIENVWNAKLMKGVEMTYLTSPSLEKGMKLQLADINLAVISS